MTCRRVLWLSMYLLILFGCVANPETKQLLRLTIHPSVGNTDHPDVQDVITLWHNYLSSQSHYVRESGYWHSSRSQIPDAFLWSLHLNNVLKPMQNDVLGVYPVDGGHYALKSAFMSPSSSQGDLQLDHIVTVYAQKIEGQFKLINSADYHRTRWEKNRFGRVTYYVHPEHVLHPEEALAMDSFNDILADQFEVPPLEFEYFVCNNARSVLSLLGFDFTPRQFQQMQSGGMAANYDNVIYAGNNSAFYPHELVHLYTYAKFKNQYHPWIDEGVATLFGGSSGYELEWHLQKLASFLNQNPSFPINNLSKLATDIPNGEHITDFRYAIGGLICKLIFDQGGMPAIFKALQAGRSDQDFFKFLQSHFGVQQEDFGVFVRNHAKPYFSEDPS